MSENKLHILCASLFEDFVNDDQVKVNFGGVSITLDRKTIGHRFCAHFGLEVARERAKEIKVRLKDKDDLFWRYAAAMSFYDEQKMEVEWYDYWKKIESACKDFLKCKIPVNEFKLIISKIPDDKSFPPFDFHKTHLTGKLRAFYGQNWQQSYPFPLRDAIYDAVEILYSTYRENVFEEPQYKKIFEEVYEHLQLFGIKLDSPKVIDNIYYHHKTQRSQNTDP